MYDISKSGVMRKVGVYVGRFQPFHLGHASVIKQMIADGCELILILVGSAKNARTPVNPFRDIERVEVINGFLTSHCPDKTKYSIIPIPDFLRDSDWEERVQQVIRSQTYQNDRVLLYGHDKDSKIGRAHV